MYRKLTVRLDAYTTNDIAETQHSRPTD